jgi:hypothetical protein
MLIAILSMVYLLSLEERSRPIKNFLYFLYSEFYSALMVRHPKKEICRHSKEVLPFDISLKSFIGFF